MSETPPAAPEPPPPPPPPPPPGSGPAGPPLPPVPFWRLGRLVVPEADASPASQTISYVVVTYGIGMVAHVAGETGLGVGVATALLLGVLVGLATGSARIFRNAPGAFLGILASVVTLVATGITSGVTDTEVDGRQLALIAFGVGAFVTGLDWTRVARLRGVIALAAVPVLIVSADRRGQMLVIGLAWLASAVVALWSLECDQRAGYEDPRPLTQGSRQELDVGSRDLAGAAGIALLLGLLFAFSASMPSCSPSIPGLGRFGINGPRIDAGRLPFDTDRLSIDDIRFGDFPFDFSGDLPTIEIDGVEHVLREGLSGMLFLENTETGERYALSLEGGDLVARDRFGDVYAVIRKAEPGGGGGSSPWKPILVVVAAVAAAAGAWWYLRRRRPPPTGSDRRWAEDLVERIDRFGRQHSTPRRRSETVVHHVDVLHERIAPDPRLPGVARILSDALFGREQPTVEQRLWAEQVVDEVVAAHPPPGRASRFRRKRSNAAEDPAQPTIGRP